MTVPRSLQGRLSLALALGLTVLWTAAAVVTTLILHEELDQVFDSALEETGQRILPVAVLEILNREEDDAITQRVTTLRAHEEYFTYLVRDAGGTVLMRSHAADEATFPPFTGTGFASTPTHRIYHDAALQGTVTISVAEPLAHRREVARETVWALALPLALLVPLSLLGVWALVRGSMRPIRAFRDAIAMRGSGDLAPVPAGRLPAEIEPVAGAVNALLDRLRRALEAERSFTANAAHELRTPVAAALAQTQRLIAETGEGAARDRAQDIEAALKRLARLSEKLMQLARAEGGRLRAERAMDIAPVLGMVVDELRKGACGTGRIEVRMPEGEIQSVMDPDAFAILTRNLIENALRHGASDEPVQVVLTRDGVLRVINGGPPVPTETLNRLFRRFERGRTAADGFGLGLAIADAIARGSGARLVLHSPALGRTDGFEAVLSLNSAT
ncbi:two-component system OmpR family sensor kinase [Skermanella aerolata]|uniref:sensor histidine kinase n=1 Tax=Skermanella aerolata TaxID=393310 RepID=UPI003D252A9F